MKRLLRALAVLWSLVSRSRPIPCKSADLPIRRFAKGQPSELAHPHISESTLNNKTIFHLDRRYYNVLAYMTLFMCLIAAFKAPAQTGAAVNMDEIQPLQIGDTIPEELWHLPLQVVNHPEGKETITLNDYRGKLIILDFWATWCGSCIAMFPKVDSIQRKVGHEIQLILVNSRWSRDNAEKIIHFFSHRTNPSGLQYVMPSIVNDSLLCRAFPHKSIPHYVWISRDGVAIGFTDSKALSHYNIAKIKAENNFELPSKYTPRHIETNNRILQPQFSICPKNQTNGLVADKQPDLSSSRGMLGQAGKYHKIYFINQPLISLLTHSISPIRNIPNYQILVNNRLGTGRERDLEPELDQTYCYELIVDDPVTLDSLSALMRKDLLECFGYLGEIVPTKIKTLILTVSSPNLLRVGDGGVRDNNLLDSGVSEKYVHNQPITALVHALSTIHGKPVVDSTGYTETLSLRLPADLSDLQALAVSLKNQGLQLKEEIVELDLLHISRKFKTD